MEFPEQNNVIEGDSFKWSPGDIRCLVHNFTLNTTMFDRFTKKKVWNDIAEELSKTRGKLVSGDQCIGKWKGLKSMYKKVKDHNNTSGNAHKYWEYYDIMDEVLNNRPEISPPATCSSDEPSVRINNSRAIAEPSCSSDDFDFIDTIEVTPTISTPSVLQRKRKASEDEKNRRHNEKMKRTDKFLDLFQQFINKI